MPCLPPMTGNGNHTTYKNGDDCGIVDIWHCFTHMILKMKGAKWWMAHGILWDEFDGISKRIICPFGKNSLGPGAGDHPICHQTSLLLFRASFKALLFSSTNQWECGTSMELDYGQWFKIDIYIYGICPTGYNRAWNMGICYQLVMIWLGVSQNGWFIWDLWPSND